MILPCYSTKLGCWLLDGKEEEEVDFGKEEEDDWLDVLLTCYHAKDEERKYVEVDGNEVRFDRYAFEMAGKEFKNLKISFNNFGK